MHGTKTAEKHVSSFTRQINTGNSNSIRQPYRNTENIEPLKKSQNIKILKCCRLGLIEPGQGR